MADTPIDQVDNSCPINRWDLLKARLNNLSPSAFRQMLNNYTNITTLPVKADLTEKDQEDLLEKPDLTSIGFRDTPDCHYYTADTFGDVGCLITRLYSNG